LTLVKQGLETVLRVQTTVQLLCQVTLSRNAALPVFHLPFGVFAVSKIIRKR